MTRDDFDAARREICFSGPASAEDNLLGMEIDFGIYLGDPDYDDYNDDDAPSLWRDMAVSRAERSEWLVAGRARGRRQDADAIGSELACIWLDTLSYRFREAHTVERFPDEVALLGVTQIGPGELWVTAKVRILLDA